MDTRAALTPATVAIEADGAMVVIAWTDGRASRFPAIWLADNRPEIRHGVDGQRSADTLDLPERVTVRRAAIVAAGVEITFSCFERPSLFPSAWLRDHALDAASRAARRRPAELWDGALAAHLRPRPTMR